MRLFSLAAGLLMAAASTAQTPTKKPDCLMYLTGQHDVIPSRNLTQSITHVILAFARSDTFLQDVPEDSDYGLFTSIGRVRAHFEPDTKVTVAIGGWGDWQGFQKAARTPESRAAWAARVGVMAGRLGLDGIDIDWEYPGGNRDDYKEIPNSERVWEIEAFVGLMQELRSVLGPNKILSAAVPGREEDMMAFTNATMPRLIQALDFINVMTYDLMNRRVNHVMHHSGITESKNSIQAYMDRGAPAEMLNLGLGYYVKWFMTQPGCNPDDPIGCPTQLMEDPETGADLGKTGMFSWHDKVPSDVAESFSRALTDGFYDGDGSYGYWDQKELRWWSFDTSKVIEQKMKELVHPMNLGGAFAWGLGEDAPNFDHLKATITGLETPPKPYLFRHSRRHGEAMPFQQIRYNQIRL